MKRILLASAAAAALSTSAFAADLGFAPEPVPVDIWSGYFVGLQLGYAWKEQDTEVFLDGTSAVEFTLEGDDVVGGVFYGRNWQFDNFVIGLDSSISYIGFDETDLEGTEYSADWLGLSRLKLGYAIDNTLLFVAGGLSTTWVEVDIGGADDDSFAFGWNVGAGVEHKFDQNWSARLEYIYFSIEEDDLSVESPPNTLGFETDIDGHIVRAGVAYHF